MCYDSNFLFILFFIFVYDINTLSFLQNNIFDVFFFKIVTYVLCYL